MDARGPDGPRPPVDEELVANMRAVYISEFGPPDKLEIREVDAPEISAPDEILVRVAAAGVNRADLLQRQGMYPAPEGYPQEIPGLEFAGTVEKTGSEAKIFAEGDRVFGIIAGGAQAEYAVVSEAMLARIPDSLTFSEAAAVPEAFITAHDAIRTQGRLDEGESLLIHAVGSGVGLAALQLGKAFGAFVTGTSRTGTKLEKCAEFGLDLSIHTGGEPHFAEIVRGATGGADVILDLVGGSYLEENLKALAPQGRLIVVGLVGGRSAKIDLSLLLRTRATMLGTVLRSRSIEEKTAATRAFTDEVIPLLESGDVRPVVDTVFPLDEVSKAHEYMESNKNFGKIVLSLE